MIMIQISAGCWGYNKNFNPP